jgi:hypothetical protein
MVPVYLDGILGCISFHIKSHMPLTRPIAACANPRSVADLPSSKVANLKNAPVLSLGVNGAFALIARVRQYSAPGSFEMSDHSFIKKVIAQYFVSSDWVPERHLQTVEIEKYFAFQRQV